LKTCTLQFQQSPRSSRLHVDMFEHLVQCCCDIVSLSRFLVRPWTSGRCCLTETMPAFKRKYKIRNVFLHVVTYWLNLLLLGLVTVNNVLKKYWKKINSFQFILVKKIIWNLFVALTRGKGLGCSSGSHLHLYLKFKNDSFKKNWCSLEYVKTFIFAQVKTNLPMHIKKP